MPACVDCGAEKPRDEMYGPPDELRCRACVHVRFPVDPTPVRRRPRARPPITVFLIGMAVIVSLLYHSGVQQTLWLFADKGIWQGQLWRLVTAAFPHLSPLHLVFNLFWTWRFGKDVENALGSLRFAGFFVATAAGATAAEFLYGNFGAGLSGVGYALFGLLFALREDEDYAAWHMSPAVIQTFVGWFFLCLALTWFDILAAANVAHAAGAILGWLFGRAFLASRKTLATAAVGLLCVALSLATLYMPWDFRYAVYRYRQAILRGDHEQAFLWLEQAEKNRGWWEGFDRFKMGPRRRLGE